MHMYKKPLSKSWATAFAVIALSGALISTAVAGEFGTATEAKALLTKAVAAIKENKTEALAKFNSGADMFKDRDLYVFCFGADGIETAGPAVGQVAKDIVDKNGKMLGQEIMKVAKVGKISQVKYMWPRPGTTDAVQKITFVTKADDQVCGVGYYK